MSEIEQNGRLDSPTGSDNAYVAHTLLFTRIERVDVTAMACLQLETLGVLDDTQVFSALKRAVTEWVIGTESGRDAWLRSCEDLNIGDLACDDSFADVGLRSRMEAHGLRFVKVITGLGERSWHYDTVLANPGPEPECEPDEIHESSEQ